MTKTNSPISNKVGILQENDWQFYLQAGVGLHEEPARSSWIAQAGLRCEYEIVPQLRIFSEANFSRSIKHWVTSQAGHSPYHNLQLLLAYDGQIEDQPVEGLGFSRDDVLYQRREVYLEKNTQQDNDPLYRIDVPLGINTDSFFNSHLSFDLFSGVSFAFTKEREIITGNFPYHYSIAERIDPKQADLFDPSTITQVGPNYYHYRVRVDIPGKDVDVLAKGKPKQKLLINPLLGAGARWMLTDQAAMNLRTSWSGDLFLASFWLEYRL